MIRKYYFKRKLISFSLGILFSLLSILPAYGAEKITLVYGPFNLSISVKSLEKFVRDGVIDRNLAFYFKFFSEGQKAKFREFLASKYNVNTFNLRQLGQTYAGEQLFTVLGKGIKIPGGQGGYDAIRDSVIYTSSTPEGLSLINVIKNFPTDIQVDVNYFLQSFQEILGLVKDTQVFIKSLPPTDRVNPAINNPVVPDLELKTIPQSNISKQTLSLYDPQRDRPLKVLFYLPQSEQTNLPVIVISNGLGAHIERFDRLAYHLASSGFAVIIPDHPNSNDERQQGFYEGLYSEPFDATEFIDRPLDITFVLDSFEKLNSTQFNNKLNLEKVGIVGYSFGGATAFALAGAKINFQQLEKDCQSPNGFYNISILYQCRALELPKKSYNLQDKRIKAIFAFFPFCSSLYGESQMSRVQIPVFWQATDTDVITPLLIEQVPPFTWLGSSEKYLAIAEKLAHTRIILNAMNKLGYQQFSEEQIVETTRHYLNTFSLAFFKVYIVQNERYRSYLTPAYASSITQEPFQLHLIQNLQFINE